MGSVDSYSVNRIIIPHQQRHIARDDLRQGAHVRAAPLFAIFIGAQTGRPIGDAVMPDLLERMGRHDVTVHGFRSTFKDWASETTAYPNHVVEQALAHAIGNGVEAAYRRGDLFEKRRRLMQDWSEYCDRPHVEGDVVPLRA